MVTEHRRRGFPEELLSSTFSICSWGNGVVAIVAGFLAQVAADISGDIGPFQLAILLTAFSLVLILFWRENYGGDSSDSSHEASLDSTLASIFRSCAVILRHPRILFLGLGQAFFEGAVYTFGMLSSLKCRVNTNSVHVGPHPPTALSHHSAPHRTRILCIYAVDDPRWNAFYNSAECLRRT